MISIVELGVAGSMMFSIAVLAFIFYAAHQEMKKERQRHKSQETDSTSSDR